MSSCRQSETGPNWSGSLFLCWSRPVLWIEFVWSSTPPTQSSSTRSWARLRGRLGETTIDVVSTGADREEGAYLVETGYGYAVNRGLEVIDTELVAFVDDDDELLPRHYAQLEAVLQPDAGIGVAYSRVLVVSPDGSTRPFQKGELPEGKIRAAILIGRHPVLLPTTLIHRSVLEAVGPMDEGLDRKADTDMVVRIGAATRLVAVNDPTYIYYRVAHGSQVLDRALTEMALLLRKHKPLMNRRERWVAWDALCRSATQADLPDLAQEAATEAVAVFWPRPPSPVVAAYLWLRGLVSRLRAR